MDFEAPGNCLDSGVDGRGVAPTGTLPPVSTKDFEEIDHLTLNDSKHDLP